MSLSQQTGIPTITHALWKLERGLVWYGFTSRHIGAVEPTPEGTLRAEISENGNGSPTMAIIDRWTGQLRLERQGMARATT